MPLLIYISQIPRTLIYHISNRPRSSSKSSDDGVYVQKISDLCDVKKHTKKTMPLNHIISATSEVHKTALLNTMRSGNNLR